MYSPECVEEQFSEHKLPLYGILGSWHASWTWTVTAHPAMLVTTHQRTLECACERRPLRPDLYRRPARRGYTREAARRRNRAGCRRACQSSFRPDEAHVGGRLASGGGAMRVRPLLDR